MQKKALDILESEIPNLIILDTILPEMNGFQLLALLQETKQLKEIPVILATGVEQIEDQLRGINIGAVDYITKPFNKDLIKIRVALQLELNNHKKTS